MIETEWEDLLRMNSLCNIFTRFDHYFHFNLDEIYLLFNEVELKIIEGKYKPPNTKNCSETRFSIIFLRTGIAAGVNSPVILLEKGNLLHHRLRGANLVNKYGLLEGSFFIPNKAEYMDDETWAKVMKVISPVIIKMKARNFAFVLRILFYIYLTPHSVPPNYLHTIRYFYKC